MLEEAEKLSEEHGIPFYPEKSIINGMAQGYMPQSFDSIYGELVNDDETSDMVSELTGVYKHNTDDYSGWQSSSNNC